MRNIRPVDEALPSEPTMEGAGVRLRRAFAAADERLDPFLLLDDFHSNNPRDYLAGFPWHPHRGIETITYMLNGEVEHADSMGNRGSIHPGDVQWMTAGSGIIHQEMPIEPPDSLLHGFQLWSNLPASHKMMAPRYRDVKKNDIPAVKTRDGALVKIICGECGGVAGPVRDIITEPLYLDVYLEPGTSILLPIPEANNLFCYTIDGETAFGPEPAKLVPAKHLVIFGAGASLQARASSGPGRFLLVSGRPLREPVAWGGPIVMNTQAELRLAFEEYQNGTFLKENRRD